MTLVNPVHIRVHRRDRPDLPRAQADSQELARSLGSGMREFRESLSVATQHDSAPTLAARQVSRPSRPAHPLHHAAPGVWRAVEQAIRFGARRQQEYAERHPTEETPP